MHVNAVVLVCIRNVGMYCCMFIKYYGADVVCICVCCAIRDLAKSTRWLGVQSVN